LSDQGADSGHSPTDSPVNFAFSSAIGPISWAYPVEIMSTAIRAKGTAITSSAAWISNFMIAQVTPIAFREIGWR
jgi:hypothetical protein